MFWIVIAEKNDKGTAVAINEDKKVRDGGKKYKNEEKQNKKQSLKKKSYK